MTKPKLTELAKARVDAQTKQDLEQLTLAFGHQDESDTVRDAFREFIDRHRHKIPRVRPLSQRRLLHSR